MSQVSTVNNQYKDMLNKLIAPHIDSENFFLHGILEYLKGDAIKLMRIVTIKSSDNEMNTNILSETALPESLDRFIQAAFASGDTKASHFCSAVLLTLILGAHHHHQSLSCPIGVNDSAEREKRAIQYRSMIERSENLAGIGLKRFDDLDDDLKHIFLSLAYCLDIQSSKGMITSKIPFTSIVVEGQASLFMKRGCMGHIASDYDDTFVSGEQLDHEASLTPLSLIVMIKILRSISLHDTSDAVSQDLWDSKVSEKLKKSSMSQFLHGCLFHVDVLVVVESAKLLEQLEDRAATKRRISSKSVSLVVQRMLDLLKLHENDSSNSLSFTEVSAILCVLSETVAKWVDIMPQNIVKECTKFIFLCTSLTSRNHSEIEQSLISSVIQSNDAILMNFLSIILYSLPHNVETDADISEATHGLNVLKCALESMLQQQNDEDSSLTAFLKSLERHAAYLVSRSEQYAILIADLYFSLLKVCSSIKKKITLVNHAGSLIESLMRGKAIHADNNTLRCTPLLVGLIKASTVILDDCSDLDNLNSLDSIIESMSSKVVLLNCLAITQKEFEVVHKLHQALNGSDVTFAHERNHSFGTDKAIVWKCSLYALRSLKRYFSLHADAQSKRVTLHSMGLIARATYLHESAPSSERIGISDDCEQFFDHIAALPSSQKLGFPEVSVIGREAKLAKFLLGMWKKIITQIRDTDRLPSLTTLKLFDSEVRLYLPKELHQEASTAEVNDIASAKGMENTPKSYQDDPLDSLLADTKLSSFVGNFERNAAESLFFQLTDPTSAQDFNIEVYPHLSETHFVLFYRITNNISVAHAPIGIDMNGYTAQNIQIEMAFSGCDWPLQSKPDFVTTIEMITPGETRCLAICFKINTEFDIYSIKSCASVTHHMEYTLKEENRAFQKVFNPFDDFLDVQGPGALSIKIPRYALPTLTFLNATRLGSDTTPKAFGSQWKILDESSTSPKSLWELSKHLTIDSDDIEELLQKLTQHSTSLSMMLDPKEHKLRRLDGSVQEQGYYVIWMSGEVVHAKSSKLIMIQCKCIPNREGQVACYASIRGGSAFIRQSVCDEVFAPLIY